MTMDIMYSHCTTQLIPKKEEVTSHQVSRHARTTDILQMVCFTMFISATIIHM